MRKKKSKASKRVQLQGLPLIHPHAAGIDVGAKEHVVAVPCDRDLQPVRTFQAFTPELHELAAWLKRCRIQTVALESTGIYWISLYEVLEQHGFEVRVVNARHVKNVPGRTKTDVLDCQWIQKLHSFGLLKGSFRPDHQIRKLRTYMRLRDNLVVERTQAIHHMQKALFEINVQLSNVISDIVGETGLRIIEAILAGERDPEQLAALCSTRIKSSHQTVAKRVTPDAEGALIRFQATKVEYRRRQSHPGERPPRRDAFSYELSSLDQSNPPMVWNWDEAISETLSLLWSKKDGPVPVCPGMSVTVTLDSAGSLQDISFVAGITHWRTGPNGLIEVVLGYEIQSPEKKMRYLYLRPARMCASACGLDIHWTRRWGLLITIDDAGPDDAETEDLSSFRQALPLANTSEVQVIAGRDGWHVLPGLKIYSDELDDTVDVRRKPARKAWEALYRAIPKRQYMRGAG